MTDPQWPALEPVESAVRAEIDSQRQRIAGLDQRAGIVVSGAAVLVGLSYQSTDGTAKAATLVAVAAAAAALVGLWPVIGSTLDPRAVVRRYAGGDPDRARRVLLSTAVVEYEVDRSRLRIKGWAIRIAVLLIS